uniref:Uncharacterized protein n=1 Tax=Thermodesulfobacterium geofontis TaxID=1295609 RepID=A0A7V6CDE3_9BACT
MGETYKIYLVFWGPIIILAILAILLLFLFKPKNTLVPSSEITLPSSYIEVLNELNSLNYLKPFRLVENYSIIVDPFSAAFKGEALQEKTFASELKPIKTFHLSMIYIEGAKKVCIINNIRFVEKSKLDKDIKIIKIGDYYVDLQIKNKIERLFLGQTLSF